MTATANIGHENPKTAFVHCNPQGKEKLFISMGTVAVDMPLKEYLTTAFLQHANKIMLNVGFSIVHPDDNFNKKIGRDVSQSKMKFRVFTLVYIEIKDTNHIYHVSLDVKKKEPKVELGFATSAETNHVKLLYGRL